MLFQPTPVGFEFEDAPILHHQEKYQQHFVTLGVGLTHFVPLLWVLILLKLIK
jgi:hypothetical protein